MRHILSGGNIERDPSFVRLRPLPRPDPPADLSVEEIARVLLLASLPAPRAAGNFSRVWANGLPPLGGAEPVCTATPVAQSPHVDLAGAAQLPRLNVRERIALRRKYAATWRASKGGADFAERLRERLIQALELARGAHDDVAVDAVIAELREVGAAVPHE